MELLDDEARKKISEPLLEGGKSSRQQHNIFCNFIFHPCVLGKKLFSIIRFGLVQYVLPLLLLVSVVALPCI